MMNYKKRRNELKKEKKKTRRECNYINGIKIVCHTLKFAILKLKTSHIFLHHVPHKKDWQIHN